MAATASHWCYQCNRLIRVWDLSNLVCPHCDSGFIEVLELSAAVPPSPSSPESSRRSPVLSEGSDSEGRVNLGFRRSRRSNRGDRSPFNPVILLRSPGNDGDGGGGGGGERLYQLYYDDGAGTGLRPLPANMSEILLGSGFDRLLDQLAQVEINRQENPPASKAAIESMPTISILSSHVSSDLHCAVCKEAFAVGCEAREMPCSHIYHPDCILPWLSLRNSCPVCRHELHSDAENGSDSNHARNENELEPIGLTIWRLPGGGYAVGRFSGREREFPVVYTEMDGGGHSNNLVPRRVVWGTRRRRSGGRGFFGNLSSFFRRFTSSGNSITRSRSVSGGSSSVFSRYLRRSRRGWAVEEPAITAI